MPNCKASCSIQTTSRLESTLTPLAVIPCATRTGSVARLANAATWTASAARHSQSFSRSGNASHCGARASCSRRTSVPASWTPSTAQNDS